MSLSRRGFLKALAGTAGAAVATGVGAESAEAREAKKMPDGAIGLLYDGTLCVGCNACVAACKRENGMPPEQTELVQGNYWDAPLDISGKTLNVIKLYRSGTGDRKDVADNGFAFTKLSCYHCVDPSCVSVCPVSAMNKDPVTGLVSYNEEACIGCRYCMTACPFFVPRFTFDKAFAKITKCELCKGRLEKGQIPACAEVCPTGATLFGPVEKLKAEAARRRSLPPGTDTSFPRQKVDSTDRYPGKVAKYVDHMYGDREVGGTQVLHLSGVPFELLGKPTLSQDPPARRSEALQHGIYRGMYAPLTFLAGLVFFAWRNMREPTAEEKSAAAPKRGGEA